MSAPPAPDMIVEDMAARAAVFAVSSANFAAGAPGVPAGAHVAAAAALRVASELAFADMIPAAAAPPTPRHAGRKPISTFGLPGPGWRTGGKGCTTGSVILAAGPVG